MELVILAAGQGSRFGGLKQIEPMDEYGNFIIDYSIYDAIEAGFDSITFIIQKEMYETFLNTIGKRIEGKVKVRYIFQDLNDLPEGFVCPIKRIKPWGTAQAILEAYDIIKENFVIINSDDFYGKDAFKVAAHYLRKLNRNECSEYGNVVYHLSNTLTEHGSVKRGVCFEDYKGMLTKILESNVQRNSKGRIIVKPLDSSIEPFEVKDKIVSMNMFIFTIDIMEHLKEQFPLFLQRHKKDILDCEYLIPSVISSLIKDEKVSVKLLSTSSIWYGITYHEDKEEVVDELKKLTLEGLYKPGLW